LFTNSVLLDIIERLESNVYWPAQVPSGFSGRGGQPLFFEKNACRRPWSSSGDQHVIRVYANLMNRRPDRLHPSSPAAKLKRDAMVASLVV